MARPTGTPPDIGGIPLGRIEDPEVRRVLLRVKEIIGSIQSGTVGVAGAPAPGPTPVPGPPGPPGPPGEPVDPTPDLTPPPTPSGVTVTAGLDFVFIQTDPPTFTQGHGYARTLVYGAKWTSGPLPTFASAELVHEFVGQVGSFPAEPNTQWHVWVTWVTEDAVESIFPEGGTNGHQVTTAAIGNAHLGDLIIQAEQLAVGAIDLTTNKVTANAAFGALAVGYTVTQYLVATSGVMQNLLVTNAQIVDLAATKITAGSLNVGAYIQSSDFIDGTAGWRIGGNGVAQFAASHIRGLLTAAQIDTRGLDIRDPAGNIILSASQNLDWNRLGGALKPKVFRVISRGLGSVGHPAEASLRNAETNTSFFGANRSYNLVLISRSTGAVTFTSSYDVYGAGANGGTALTLADDLNNTSLVHSGVVVVLFTYDEPQSHRTDSGLPAAIYRNGGTPGKFESPLFQSRGAYMLISYGGCGQGNALFEGYAGVLPFGTDGPDDAWIDTTFSLVNGNVLVGGPGMAGFKLDASNITTYIAGAAIGNALIGGTISSDDYIAGLSGWAISKSGSAEFNTGTFRGTLAAASGTFAGALTAATGSFATSAGTGKRITLNEGGSNEERFYGDRGDGVIEMLASLGINTDPNTSLLYLGSPNTSRSGIYIQTNSGNGIFAVSNSGFPIAGVSNSNAAAIVGSGTAAGIEGQATTGYGVRGLATSGQAVLGNATGSGDGVRGTSVSGYGGRFVGNGTNSPIFLTPQSGVPASVAAGGIAIITNTAVGLCPCYADGGNWRRFSDNEIWNIPPGGSGP